MPNSAPAFQALRARLAERAPRLVEAPNLLETAVALILAPGDRGLEALFIRRAERVDDPWSGHIALPGGRRELIDADRLATAVRETREEVGVELPLATMLGFLDDVTPRTPRLPPLVIRPYVFGLEKRPRPRPSDEVADVLWLPLAELPQGQATTDVPILGVATSVPCFTIGRVVIWGLTYRILSDFLELIHGAK